MSVLFLFSRSVTPLKRRGLGRNSSSVASRYMLRKSDETPEILEQCSIFLQESGLDYDVDSDDEWEDPGEGEDIANSDNVSEIFRVDRILLLQIPLLAWRKNSCWS